MDGSQGLYIDIHMHMHMALSPDGDYTMGGNVQRGRMGIIDFKSL